MQKQKINFFIDQLPWPPRNGVTLPAWNYLLGLMKYYCVNVLYLHDENNDLNNKSLLDNEKIFGKIRVIKFRKGSSMRRVRNEIIGREMYQHGWDVFDNGFIDIPEADFALVSPISAVAKFNKLQSCSLYKNSIAIIHDCAASEYYNRYKSPGGGFSWIARGAMDHFRSKKIGVIEGRLLNKFSKILVQTEMDRFFIKKLVGHEVAKKTEVAPNGVNEVLFDINRSGGGGVLFVGDLGGEYKKTVLWLVNDVMFEMDKVIKNYNFTIIGKNADNEVMEAFGKRDNIIYHNYVDSLNVFYEQADVVLSPLFKGFGLINKTLEAMAAAAPVVGGCGAFNGIEGFENGVHGVLVEKMNAKVYAGEIIKILSNTEDGKKIGDMGRELIRGKFEWKCTIDKIANFFEKS